MPDPTQTVESIRQFLRTDGGNVSAELSTVAADYADLCHEANIRLRRCADYLQQGLRGEALDYASNRPALIEFVASLELKEAENWARVCGTLGMPRPLGLAMEVTQELKEAVKKHEPVRELLPRLRYLSLARAPLIDRLAVLQQLIDADPRNTIWKRDAEELERARFAEFRAEAAAAIRDGNIGQVDKLLAELNNRPRQTPIPDGLKEDLVLTLVALRRAAAAGRLQALVPAVRQAYAAKSYDPCRQVFALWGRVVQDSGLPVPPDLRQEIIPLAHWLDAEEDRREQERHFRAACNVLVQGVNGHASIEELQILYRDVTAFKLDVPTEVVAAHRRGIDSARKEQSRERLKQFALGAALVSVIVLALAALTYVILHTSGH